MSFIYRPTLDGDIQQALNALAAELGFFVEQKGRHIGKPSPPALLDALAGRWRDDPEAVAAALRALGIEKSRST